MGRWGALCHHNAQVFITHLFPPGPNWRRCHPSLRSLNCLRVKWRRGPCRILSNLWLMWKWLKAKRWCWNARWRACPTQPSPGTTTASALRAAKNAKWPSVSKEANNKRSWGIFMAVEMVNKNLVCLFFRQGCPQSGHSERLSRSWRRLQGCHLQQSGKSSLLCTSICHR